MNMKFPIIPALFRIPALFQGVIVYQVAGVALDITGGNSQCGVVFQLTGVEVHCAPVGTVPGSPR